MIWVCPLIIAELGMKELNLLCGTREAELLTNRSSQFSEAHRFKKKIQYKFIILVSQILTETTMGKPQGLKENYIIINSNYY